MRSRVILIAIFAALAIGYVVPAAAAQSLLLEWADRPANPEWIGGDPVFQRTLLCWTEGRQDICKLTVVSIGRAFCPAVLATDAFRTDTGDLKVSRTETSADLEFTDLSNTWTLHLKLIGGVTPIVEQASGVVVTRSPSE